MQILVDLDGVIKGQDDEPIRTGILMYAALAAYNRVTIMSPWSQAETVDWMDANKVVDYDAIVDNSVFLTDEDPKQRQVNYVRASGGIDLLITNDPNLWSYAFDLGIACSLFGIPRYTRAEFRPDAPKKVRSWDAILQSVEKQNALRTQDLRLQRGEGIRFEK